MSLDVSNVLDPSDKSLEGLRGFVRRNGYIVWGIVPNDDRLDDVTVEDLADRLQFWLERLAPDEEERKRLVTVSMVSTAGGLAGLDEVGAERALALTAELSKTARARNGYT